MKTISVLAYRRPEYLCRCLDALADCRGISDYSVVVSIDGPSHPLASKESPQRKCYYHAYYSGLSPQILTSECRMGVADHPAAVYDAVMAASDFNIAIEDDCLLMRDALELAEHFYKNWSRQYLFMSLGRFHDLVELPDIIREADEITSPWAWCFTKEAWHMISPWWNSKTIPPLGWDWSLTYNMYRHGWKALRPDESRAINIGRDDGENGNPDWWDRTWKHADHSSGEYQGPYCLKPGTPPTLKYWMEAEANKDGLVRNSV